MKIYTTVTFEWDQDQERYVEIESESYEYDGQMALCFGGGGDDGGLTSGQRSTLNKQKADVQERKGDVSEYFQELNRMGQTERSMNTQTRIDDFLSQSYLLDKKNDAAIAGGKGLTNFETDFDVQMQDDIRMDKFAQESSKDKLDYMKGTIERNKARFDQLASLEDMIYQIDTELKS
tara:strand:- start:67 stop:597 length:531 start_codon:yes stop_codon:yes gene_type:complete